MKQENKYHQDLQKLMDEFAHKIYDYTKNFPREEMFGLTSQLRRAAISVVLNYIEGYARQGKNVLRNFLKISYGSLKESQYLIKFSHKRTYFKKQELDELLILSDKIGAMVWGIISKLQP